MSWAFYIVAIALAINFITVFLLMPETAYFGPRPSITLDTLAQEVSVIASEKAGLEDVTGTPTPISEALSEIPQKAYLQSLKPWGVVNPDTTLLRAFLRPFVLVA